MDARNTKEAARVLSSELPNDPDNEQDYPHTLSEEICIREVK